jgi:hypothetical protein
MLEHRSRPRTALIAWIARTPIFRKALQCEDDPDLAVLLATATADRLVADGVLVLDGEMLRLAGA